MASEKSILNETIVRVSALPETCVWRNNTGMAWQGQQINARVGTYVKVERDMVLLRDARPVRFGLPGSSDIIGAHAGRPVAIETKAANGQQAELQSSFERAWVKAGGLYVLARTASDAPFALRSSS